MNIRICQIQNISEYKPAPDGQVLFACFSSLCWPQTFKERKTSLNRQPLSLPFCGCKSTTFPQTHKHFFQLFCIIQRYSLTVSEINFHFFQNKGKKGVLVVPDYRISTLEIDGDDVETGLQVHGIGGNVGFRREIVQRMRVMEPCKRMVSVPMTP